jgi:hypothetical protein
VVVLERIRLKRVSFVLILDSCFLIYCLIICPDGGVVNAYAWRAYFLTDSQVRILVRAFQDSKS